MADTNNLSNFLTDVANAIREKKHISETIAAENFDTEILSIPSGSGSDTYDATATTDDVIAPKTFYAQNKKQTGSIKVTYTDTGNDIIRNRISTVVKNVCDYRDDLGFYLVINATNNTVEIYRIQNNELVRTLNADSSLTSNTITSALKIRNAKFSKSPVADTVYNICVSAGNYANGKGYDVIGLGVARFDTTDPTLDLTQFKYYHQDGSSYNTSNRIHSTGLVECDNYVYSTVCSTSNYWQSNAGSTRLYYINNDENTITLKYSYSTGGDYGHIPYMTEGCRFVVLMNAGACKILKFNDARTSATVLSSYNISASAPRCIVTNNGVIYNNRYTTNEGVVHTYETLPFDYNDTVIYSNGYLLRFVSGKNTIDVYKLDSTTYEISAFKSILLTDAYTISYVGAEGYVNLTNYPVFNVDGISVYTPSQSYLLKNISESSTIKSVNIRGTELHNTDLVTITADKVLEGTSFVNATGYHTGTIPNNGVIEIIPSTEPQSIPSGYTSGGIVNPVDSSIDIDIIPENIKLGVNILGVEGTLVEGAGDATSDANIQAKYLLEGYQMISGGKVIAGEMRNYGTTNITPEGTDIDIPTGYYDKLVINAVDASTCEGYNECLNAVMMV